MRCDCHRPHSPTTMRPETVVVTATRTPQPLDKTGTSMSVITADDIKVQQIDVVTDILAETPGLTVNRNGGAGQPTTISIRGAETGQTVVLIDGVRINDPSATDEGAILGRPADQQYRPHRNPARPAIHALWQRCHRRRGEHPHQTRRRHAVRRDRERGRRLVRHLASQCRDERHDRQRRIRRGG